MIRKLTRVESREFFARWHYSGGVGNAAMVWGWVEGGDVAAAAAYAVPCSNAARGVMFGAEHAHRVYDLQRLARAEWFSTIPLTQFLALTRVELLKHRPDTRGLTAFADSTEGHHGGIYQADNWLYTGMTGRARFWIDQSGRLRHPRQNGVNITTDDALKLGWSPVTREAKRRYVKVIGPNRREVKKWKKALLLTPLPFEKPD